MSLDINIADEFSRVLNLPITPEEARRYKENLLRQNPGSNIMNISDLYSIGDRQAITFTPSQIHQLWFKSEYLKGIDPSKYSRRQELSELLSVALLAEYLNMIYTLNIPEIPGSTFNATLFNIQAVPKPETKPDVYLHNRSHRNHLIPNIGFAENNRIEVLEYETYRYSQKQSNIPLEADIADHIICKKINKKDNAGNFAYTSDTRLLVHIDLLIDTSNVNFQEISKLILGAIKLNAICNIETFSDIFIAQYSDSSLERGKVIRIYPDYEFVEINHNDFSGNISLDYIDPIFNEK